MTTGKRPPTSNSDEQTFAFLAHLLQLFTGFIAPLVIYVAKRESRFVAFHALQALLWQLVYTVLSGLCLVLLFVPFFFAAASGSKPSPPPLGFPLFVLFFWLLMMGGWVVTVVLAIVYGIKSMRGEWAEYPIIGGWARRIVGI